MAFRVCITFLQNTSESLKLPWYRCDEPLLVVVGEPCGTTCRLELRVTTSLRILSASFQYEFYALNTEYTK